MLTKLARIGMGLAAMVLAGTTLALAETSATPASTKVAQAAAAPTASPNPFTYRGYVRAYDFTRQNAYNGTNGTGKVNQQSFNAAVSLHGDYKFAQGWTLGASYLYANPLTNCTTAVSHLTKPCGANAQPNLNPDDTLPGFEMSTLYETYLQFNNKDFFIKGGNLVSPGNQVWTPPSDSRLKPSAYQGVYADYFLNKTWALEAGDYWQWECRTCSAFDKSNLLVSGNPFGYPGAATTPNYYLTPASSSLPGQFTNSGVFFARAGYAGPKNAPLTANLSYWSYSNIGNMLWLDARMPFAGKLKPFAALQYGSEGNTGSNLVGKISASLFGLQAGFNVLPNVQIVGGFDTSPWKTDTLPAAGGTSLAALGLTCGAASHQIGVAPGVKANTMNLPYWLPVGGAAQCTANADGTTSLYYGGFASPYTDSYATDPVFTTELTQGIIDRRSAGNSFKLQATFTSDDKRLVAYINHAWFDYNNGGYANSTQETDFDALYYFQHMPKSGPYHGFSFRYRYGERNESPVWVGGTQPALFKYNRFQAEYDF